MILSISKRIALSFFELKANFLKINEIMRKTISSRTFGKRSRMNISMDKDRCIYNNCRRVLWIKFGRNWRIASLRFCNLFYQKNYVDFKSVHFFLMTKHLSYVKKEKQSHILLCQLIPSFNEIHFRCQIEQPLFIYWNMNFFIAIKWF